MSPIDAYIAKMPSARRQSARNLHRLVLAKFPNAAVGMDFKMPTYRQGGNFLAWGNKKNHLSLYTCSAWRIAAFRRKHPDIPAGVGCLNFRDKDPIPWEDIQSVIVAALAPSKTILTEESSVLAAGRDNRDGIAQLGNLGPKSAAMLERAGIRKLSQLRKLGSVRAFVKVKRAGAKPSLNLLWALEGALSGERWQDVSKKHRTSLLFATEELENRISNRKHKTTADSSTSK